MIIVEHIQDYNHPLSDSLDHLLEALQVEMSEDDHNNLPI